MNLNAAKRVLLPLLPLLATLLAVKACLPERTELRQSEQHSKENKLIIIPADNFPSLFLSSLRLRLEDQHKFGVKTAVQMGLPPDVEIPETGQVNGQKIAATGLEICRSMAMGNAYCVILINRDLNTPDSGLKYFFAQHYKGISVVSIARMNGLNSGARVNLLSTPVMFEQTLERALKMINKGLGLGYYGYGLSSNRKSVMYAPIMGLSDLDSIGGWYLDNEVKQENF